MPGFDVGPTYDSNEKKNTPGFLAVEPLQGGPSSFHTMHFRERLKF